MKFEIKNKLNNATNAVKSAASTAGDKIKMNSNTLLQKFKKPETKKTRSSASISFKKTGKPGAKKGLEVGISYNGRPIVQVKAKTAASAAKTIKKVKR